MTTTEKAIPKTISILPSVLEAFERKMQEQGIKKLTTFLVDAGLQLLDDDVRESLPTVRSSGRPAKARKK